MKDIFKMMTVELWKDRQELQFAKNNDNVQGL
jgi:hypothetical protein